MRTSLERRHQDRRPRARVTGTALLAVLLVLAVVSPAALAARPETTVVVRGVVTDASGAPVPGHIVRIIKTRTVYKFKAPRKQDQGVEEKRVRTDAEGRYEMEFALDRVFPAWFVRFYDPALFDGVKYLVPRDLEITRQAEQGGKVEAHAVLQLHPDWPHVKELIAEYGAASHRGQILRALGLPKVKEPLDEGRELWVFESAGVSYVIEGDKVLETRRTGGERPGEPAFQAVPPDGSAPAERVDDP